MERRFRFIHTWQDLGWVFEKGKEITLPKKEVESVLARMREWGQTADLCQYGLYLVPLSYLEAVEVEDGGVEDGN